MAFRLDHGGRQVLDLPPGERSLRAAELLRLDAGQLLPVRREAEVGGAAAGVEGFLTPPGNCRRSRSRQFVVVRQRPISSRPLAAAVYSGYGSLLPHNGHPEFVLWLDLDPRHLDVNVHPTKREVRFARESELRQLMQEGVREALKVPEARSFSYPSGHQGRTPRVSEKPPVDTPATSHSSYLTEPAPWDESAGQMSLTLLPESPVAGEPVPADAGGREALSEARLSTRAWQIHDKYVLIPIRDGLLVVDQHVAHERVRFEEVQDALDSEGVASQQLLIPLTVSVNPVEMEAFRQAREQFERLGFGVREFGPGSLLVDAIPPGLRHWGDGDLFPPDTIRTHRGAGCPIRDSGRGGRFHGLPHVDSSGREAVRFRNGKARREASRRARAVFLSPRTADSHQDPPARIRSAVPSNVTASIHFGLPL